MVVAVKHSRLRNPDRPPETGLSRTLADLPVFQNSAIKLAVRATVREGVGLYGPATRPAKVTLPPSSDLLGFAPAGVPFAVYTGRKGIAHLKPRV